MIAMNRQANLAEIIRASQAIGGKPGFKNGWN
jgi:hypothetical protein